MNFAEAVTVKWYREAADQGQGEEAPGAAEGPEEGQAAAGGAARDRRKPEERRSNTADAPGLDALDGPTRRGTAAAAARADDDYERREARVTPAPNIAEARQRATRLRVVRAERGQCATGASSSGEQRRQPLHPPAAVVDW